MTIRVTWIFPKRLLDVMKPLLGDQAEAAFYTAIRFAHDYLPDSSTLRYNLPESRHRCQAYAPHVLKLNSTFKERLSPSIR